MGLDMYLNRKIYFKNFPKQTQITVRAFEGAEGEIESVFSLEGVKTTSQEMLYWRKANAIHKWFVDAVQDGDDDCKQYEVEFETLEELRDLCARVLENPALAGDLLPPSEGFFFGSSEIDEGYFEDLKHTIDGIDKEAKAREELLSKHGDAIWSLYYTYQSSW